MDWGSEWWVIAQTDGEFLSWCSGPEDKFGNGSYFLTALIREDELGELSCWVFKYLGYLPKQAALSYKHLNINAYKSKVGINLRTKTLKFLRSTSRK